MFKLRNWLVLFFLVVLIAGCQTAETETVEVPVEVEVTRLVEVMAAAEPQEELDTEPSIFPHMTTDVRLYDSQATGRDYVVYVALPFSYEMTDLSYPTVYVMDGDWYTLPTAMIAGQSAFFGEMPEVITVGVGYGGTAMEAFDRREEDMFGDGSASFLQFLQEELIPDIEANYRVDPAERTLMGHSTGGEFALYTMYNAPDTFTNIIASSPFNGSLPLSLNNVHGEGLDALPVRLYASVGELEKDSLSSFEEYSSALAASDYGELAGELVVLDGESHGSIWSRAFTTGLKWVFAGWDGDL